MSPISNAAQAMSAAFVRFEHGAQALRRGVEGAPDADAASGVAEMIAAKAQLKAGVATVRIADEMMRALIDIGRRD